MRPHKSHIERRFNMETAEGAPTLRARKRPGCPDRLSIAPWSLRQRSTRCRTIACFCAELKKVPLGAVTTTQAENRRKGPLSTLYAHKKNAIERVESIHYVKG